MVKVVYYKHRHQHELYNNDVTRMVDIPIIKKGYTARPHSGWVAVRVEENKPEDSHILRETFALTRSESLVLLEHSYGMPYEQLIKDVGDNFRLAKATLTLDI